MTDNGVIHPFFKNASLEFTYLFLDEVLDEEPAGKSTEAEEESEFIPVSIVVELIDNEVTVEDAAGEGKNGSEAILSVCAKNRTLSGFGQSGVLHRVGVTTR